MRSSMFCTGASALAVLLALGAAAPASAAAVQGYAGGNQASSQTPAVPPSNGRTPTGPAGPQQNQASSQSAAPDAPVPGGADAPTPTAPSNDYMPSSVQPLPPATPMTMQEMQDKIEEMQRQLEFMKQVAAEQTAGVSAVQARPAVTLPNGRPTFATADGNFSATLNGVIQFDAGNYYQNKNLPTAITGAARDLNGGTDARRARLGFGGRVFGDFDYNILTEFGGSGTEQAGAIQELWLQYTGVLKPFHVRVGYFEPLVDMEGNVSTNSIALMERASPAEVARNIAGGDARAALQIFGNDDFKNVTFDEGKGKVHWLAAGAVTGNSVSLVNSAGAFATQPFDEQLGFIGRLGVAPYHGDDYTVHVGANVEYVIHPNDATGSGSNINGRYVFQLRDRPELRIDGTRLVDTGPLNTRHVTEAGAEFGFQFKNFYGQAEYFHYDIQGDQALPTTPSPTFDGYYIEGSYIFTGEHRIYNPANGAFNGPVVAHPFSLKDHSFGALELAGRFSDLDLNYKAGVGGAATPFGGIRGGEQKVYSVSVNWYLNPIVRLMLQGQHVDIDRLTAAGAPLGQDYNTIAVRSQLAF